MSVPFSLGAKANICSYENLMISLKRYEVKNYQSRLQSVPLTSEVKLLAYSVSLSFEVPLKE